MCPNLNCQICVSIKLEEFFLLLVLVVELLSSDSSDREVVGEADVTSSKEPDIYKETPIVILTSLEFLPIPTKKNIDICNLNKYNLMNKSIY